MSPRKYITIGYTVWYSRAVGYLHATSADDVNSPLDFDPQTISGFVHPMSSKRFY